MSPYDLYDVPLVGCFMSTPLVSSLGIGHCSSDSLVLLSDDFDEQAMIRIRIKNQGCKILFINPTWTTTKRCL